MPAGERDLLIEGEDPTSADPVDARYWLMVYEDMLAAMERGREPGRPRSPGLAAAERWCRRRVCFWSLRVAGQA